MGLKELEELSVLEDAWLKDPIGGGPYVDDEIIELIEADKK